MNFWIKVKDYEDYVLVNMSKILYIKKNGLKILLYREDGGSFDINYENNYKRDEDFSKFINILIGN